MKGIILAAGSGSRLRPLTLAVNKSLLPVYDKPLIYYPLAVLRRAGISDILIIVNPGKQPQFAALFGDGSAAGCHINYIEQAYPAGLADAFRLGADFIGKDSVCLILGDNIFDDSDADFCRMLLQAADTCQGATIFGYPVTDPRPYGVIELDKAGQVLSVEEKPATPKSSLIVPGLYFYDNSVVEMAKQLQPSARNELEITDINNIYLQQGRLNALPLPQQFFWRDIGNPDALADATQEIRMFRKQYGRELGKIDTAYPEIIEK